MPCVARVLVPACGAALTYDLSGNRESHTGRDGSTSSYTLAAGLEGLANQYGTINGVAVQYDAAGNLAVDEDGRRYAYDEAHRLIEVKSPAPDETVLAGYSYDAFGRRITSNIGGVVTRYYYDGPNVIQERSAAGALLRSHVNGAQYVDERIATVSGGLTTYYLLKENYSVAATGNADGSQIIRWDYSSGGALDGASRSRDLDADNDVDQSDFGLFQVCLNGPGVPVGPECADQDLDGDTDVDQTDLSLWGECASGPAIPLPTWCAGTVPSTFALHGRPVDVLPDGHVLQDHRARYYDPRHGR